MLGQGADEGTEGGDTVGEELKFSSGGDLTSGGTFICGDDGGNWMPLENGTIETFDPEFDSAVDMPTYSTFDEQVITTEIKMGRSSIRRFRNILLGWEASGPLRLRNLWKAARLRGRR